MTPTHQEEALQVTEGIAGYWAYHLSPKALVSRGLCGAKTMHTSIPLEQFGVGRAAPNGAPLAGRWCQECQRRAAKSKEAA